jgi:DNA-directed RNA polymerase alpha subunit
MGTTKTAQRSSIDKDINYLVKSTKIILSLLGDNRNSKLLVRRFDYLSIDELSIEFGITTTRVRQIYQKELRLLRQKFQNIDAVIKTNELLKIQNEFLRLENSRTEKDILRSAGKVKNLSISEMNISCRLYNCLKAAEIKKLSELLSFDVEQLLKFRNMGRKSLGDLNLYLEEHGLMLGGNYEFY